MRIASMVLGLMLSAWVFFEAFIINALSSLAADSSRDALIGGALIVAIFGVLGGALALALPLVSTILFGLAAIVGYSTAAGGYGNHWVYASGYVLLAALACFGWRGKRKERREKASEVQRQRDCDDRMEQLLRQSQQQPTVQCPSCGRVNPFGTRFCGSCGTAMIFGGAPVAPVALSNHPSALPKIAPTNANPKTFFDGISNSRDDPRPS